MFKFEKLYQDLTVLKSNLDDLKSNHLAEQNKVETIIKKKFAELMLEKQNEINTMVTQLEASKELTQVEHDEYFHTWIRIDFKVLIDPTNGFQKDLLTEYLRDKYCIETDFKNDAVSMSIGPAILIDIDTNEIYDQDSQQTIFTEENFRTKEGAYSLIKTWMKKNSYFPNVLKVNKYGNAYFIRLSE